jgi:HTH-type transcriptional regulator / antitoxin MqsA
MQTVRRIREKLGLSQRKASALLGGGPNAFQKYESAEAEPSQAMGVLLFLLDQHPDLLKDVPPPLAP